ncbi:MAG: FtsX-like permease family protein [Cyclobacteriaceae bacterium]|nr:FtsX-like permease family protein [Cyclobacteriaceae bacterium]
MLKSYFLVALRSLSRNKLHASINIIGLAIGMTCCILIALFVQFELGYDRQNKRADRIYRVVVDLEANKWAISAFPLGQLLKDNFAEVTAFTRIKPVEVFMLNSGSGSLIKNKEKVFYADSSVFDVMDIALVKGDPTTALANINSMVLSEERARTYFGEEDPIGKTLTMVTGKKEFVITGVFKALPSNSHVHMDIMASSDNYEQMRPDSKTGWNSLTSHYTYLVLPNDLDYISFEKKISEFLDTYQQRRPEDRRNILRLQPLTSIHLYSNRGLEIEANGNVGTVYILSAIAFFILIIACINFMNLTTAQSLKRAREVGIRKVVGSQKRQLIFQFLSESVIISFIALAISIVLLGIVVPSFNDASGKLLVINPLQNGTIVMVFMGITLFAGLVAGLYPAFFLSSFKPVTVLKGKFIGNVSGQILRKGLVVFQFAIAFIIMVGTYVVYSQLDYMLQKDIGFEREEVLVLKMPRDSVGDLTVKNELSRVAGVQSVTRFNEMPGQMVRTSTFWYEGAPDNIAANLYNFSGDPDLLNTLGMKMKAGTYFQPESKQFYKEFVINETALKHFGWKLDEAVGKMMDFGGRDSIPGRVIGVIEDFHFKHLHDAIDPLAMYLEPAYEGRFMAIKVKSTNMSEMVAAIEKEWKAVLPSYEFEYQFLDETFDKLFDQEKKLGQLFGVFSGMAILISCLGLFGLASFTMEQSRKSVAVRKVLGASVPGILFMMSKDFLKLVLMGMLIAAPLAYYATDRWLQGFSYNVGFAWIVFVYAAFVGLFVAFATVSYHSLKAATTNPVNSLKEQ